MSRSVFEACLFSREYAGNDSTIILPVVLTRRSIPILSRSSSRRMECTISRGRGKKGAGCCLLFDSFFRGALYSFAGSGMGSRSHGRTTQFGTLHRYAVPEVILERKVNVSYYVKIVRVDVSAAKEAGRGEPKARTTAPWVMMAYPNQRNDRHLTWYVRTSTTL